MAQLPFQLPVQMKSAEGGLGTQASVGLRAAAIARWVSKMARRARMRVAGASAPRAAGCGVALLGSGVDTLRALP
jgi:hypothetical protein